MKKGSKEWFQRLESNYDFPCTIAFYVDNKNGIKSALVKTKAFIENIKYSMIAPPTMLDGTKMALIKVKEVETAEDYYETVKEIEKHWITIDRSEGNE